MPELPEVENVVRSLKHLETNNLVIEEVVQADIHSLKYNSYEDFEESITGYQILTIKRRGKFILLELFHPQHWEKRYLIVHLAMTGVFMHLKSLDDLVTLEPKVYNHVFVKLRLNDGSYLIYSDYRRFGSVRVVTESDLVEKGSLSHLKTLQELGPEPFDLDAFDSFLTRIRKKKYQDKAIKDVLLDQTVIAGAGNIYASECLFEPKIYPTTRVDALSDQDLRNIFDSLVEILQRSIIAGGTSIKDYVNGEGVAGTFSNQLKVYNQTNCSVCSTELDVFYVKNRMTYACPNCQH